MPDDLNGVMRSATENLHPNIGKLTAGGIERGVRRRRNRRIAQIAGAAAGVTAVFGAVALVGGPGHGAPANASAASGQTTPAVAAKTSAPAPSPATSPTGTPQNAKTEAQPTKRQPGPPVSGEDMVSWLEQTLAPYHFTDEQVLYKGGTDDPAGAYATLKLSYATGTGSISMDITRHPWDPRELGGGTLPPYITVTTLKDGSHLMVFDGPEWPAGNGDPSAKRLDVSWYRTDGTLVDLMVLNEAQEKGSTTASGLGLTVDQATKVAQSPVWDKAIASMLG